MAPPASRPEEFIDRLPFAAEHHKLWFLATPPPLPKRPVLPEHLDQFERSGRDIMSCCLINENHLRGEPSQLKLYMPCLSRVTKVYTFKAPWGSPHPPYRFAPSITMPCGLTTNRFGFRGPEMELNKPPRTIRIACVGASTTIGCHGDAYTYPELLQHWLNLWSQHQQLGLQFEVINAGRSGITSRHIAAVVRYEVLPLNVDYVLYYEGANLFDPMTALRYRGHGGPARPVRVMNESRAPQGALDRLASYSEVARRLNVFLKGPDGVLREPAKPRQRISLPAGIDETSPDLTRLGRTLNLGDILQDLDQIEGDTRSAGARMIMTSFYFLVRDGMLLEPGKQMGIYHFYNESFWPTSYATFQRLVAFQNRVFSAWSLHKGIDFIDVAGGMPWAPELFFDGIHNYPLGHRVRAWVIFHDLLPILERDLRNGIVPVRRQELLTEHPYIQAGMMGAIAADRLQDIRLSD